MPETKMPSLRPRSSGFPSELFPSSSSTVLEGVAFEAEPDGPPLGPPRRVLFPYPPFLPDSLDTAEDGGGGCGYFMGPTLFGAVRYADGVRSLLIPDDGVWDPVLAEALDRFFQIQEGVCRDVMTAYRLNRSCLQDPRLRRVMMGSLLSSVEGVLACCVADIRALLSERVGFYPGSFAYPPPVLPYGCLLYRDDFAWAPEEASSDDVVYDSAGVPLP